jgi:hypothetical protein
MRKRFPNQDAVCQVPSTKTAVCHEPTACDRNFFPLLGFLIRAGARGAGRPGIADLSHLLALACGSRTNVIAEFARARAVTACT